MYIYMRAHTHINRLTMPLPFLACGLPARSPASWLGISPWSLSLLLLLLVLLLLFTVFHSQMNTRTHTVPHSHTYIHKERDSHTVVGNIFTSCAPPMSGKMSAVVSLAQNLYTL